MNPVQRPDSFEAASYVGVLRRRWPIILAGVIIGVVGALGYVLVAPKSYSAFAEVNVTPTGADQANSVANSRTNSGTVNLDSEAQTVASTDVAKLAGQIMHSPLTPWALTQSIAVTVPPNSSDLIITCKASTATGSAACANAFATAYLKYRSSSASASISAELKKVQGQVTTLQQQASALGSKISSLPANSSQRLSAQTDLTSVQNQLHALTDQEAGLNGDAANVAGGTILTPATPPGKPSSPKKALVLPSGLIVGLLLGLIFAFVWDRRDKRIHAASDVERLLDLPVVLNLPRRAFGQQPSIASPRSQAGQAFTELAHAVAASLGEGSHLLVVAGTTPGGSGSLVAANLAATLARTHSEVVLVCANMEDDLASQLFDVQGGRGLAEVLAGRATVRDVARSPAKIPGLYVITPGADKSLVVYHLQHDRVQSFTSQLRRDARYVVIDALATHDGANTFALAAFADAAIVTVEIPRTTQPAAEDCIRRLNQLRTPVLGAAVLPVISSRAGSGEPRPAPPLPGEPDADGAVTGPRPGEVSRLSSTPASADDGHRRWPAAAKRDGDPDNRTRSSSSGTRSSSSRTRSS